MSLYACELQDAFDTGDFLFILLIIYLCHSFPPNETASLLSVQRVPTAIVVRNDNGQKVTDLGMEGIEAYGVGIIDAWRDGTSGLSLAARAGCVVS